MPQKIKEELNTNLLKIAVFFFKTHGLPVEDFIFEINKKAQSVLHQLIFVVNFIKNNKKYCKNNDIKITHYSQI